jgi:sterol desaturase/sphingolipid hydroxylase (fatty acid hydroxylase superfamily)
VSSWQATAGTVTGTRLTAVLTSYACLGALPHANVRWTYGPIRRLVVSPAYHRIHHSATGRLDITPRLR